MACLSKSAPISLNLTDLKVDDENYGIQGMRKNEKLWHWTVKFTLQLQVCHSQTTTGPPAASSPPLPCQFAPMRT